MTAIVGLFDGERSWIAGDGRVGSGAGDGGRFSDRAVKVREGHGWVLGFSGHVLSIRRAQQLALEGLVTIDDLVAALRVSLAEIGMPTKTGADQDFELCAIAGNGSGFWHVSTYLGITELEPNRPFGTGVGADLAEGAAWQALRLGMAPGRALVCGIEAAIQYCSACGGLISIVVSAPAPGAETRPEVPIYAPRLEPILDLQDAQGEASVSSRSPFPRLR